MSPAASLRLPDDPVSCSSAQLAAESQLMSTVPLQPGEQGTAAADSDPQIDAAARARKAGRIADGKWQSPLDFKPTPRPPILLASGDRIILLADRRGFSEIKSPRRIR